MMRVLLERGRAQTSSACTTVPGQRRRVLLLLLLLISSSARGAPRVPPSAGIVGRPKLEHRRRVAGDKGAAEEDGGQRKGHSHGGGKKGRAAAQRGRCGRSAAACCHWRRRAAPAVGQGGQDVKVDDPHAQLNASVAPGRRRGRRWSCRRGGRRFIFSTQRRGGQSRAQGGGWRGRQCRGCCCLCWRRRRLLPRLKLFCHCAQAIPNALHSANAQRVSSERHGRQ